MKKTAYILKITLNMLLFLSIFLYPFFLFASIPNEDCLGCHDKYTNFNHGTVKCNQCHNDISSIPHDDKLKKPLCNSCHKPSEENYKKSIHSIKKLNCNSCHNIHFLNKDKKSCLDCHPYVSHKGLPAKERHLINFSCVVCHGVPESGQIKVQVKTGNKDIIKMKEIDRNGNKTLDHLEWDNMLNVLKKEPAGIVDIKKYYEVKIADPHLIEKKPISCKICHSEKGLFRETKIMIIGKTTDKINADPTIFIHELPSIEDYKRTVHGEKGVKCSNCHISGGITDDKVCLSCHGKIYDVYKDSNHGKKGAARCTDCHNPHKIKSYKELGAHERVMVCARCHKDYLDKHKWLPHTVLHFRYLECSTCHSPESKKSMVFEFAIKEKEDIRPFSYNDVKNIFGDKANVKKIIDLDKNGIISHDELMSFIHEMQKKSKKEININASLVVTEVYHDYSEKNIKTKICIECHSRNAPFYESMVVAIPEKDHISYMPARGTILSAFPTSVFVDIFVLGGSKIKHEDIKALFNADWQEKQKIIGELGYKLIDFVGLTVIFFIILGIIVHTFIRILVKR